MTARRRDAVRADDPIRRALLELAFDLDDFDAVSDAVPYMTCEEASARLGVSVYSIRAWIRRGAISATRVGRSWRIEPESIARLERAARGDTA